MCSLQRRLPSGEFENGVAEVFETLGGFGLLIDLGQIQKSSKNCGTRSAEVVCWDVEFLPYGKSGGAEEVDDEGANGGGFRDFLEGTADMRIVLADEVERDCGDAYVSGNIIGDARELAEGNERVGVGDAADVDGDASGVDNAAAGVENGDGEFVGAVAVDNELAQLHHGDDMPHPRRCVQYNDVSHGGSCDWWWC